MLKVKVRKIGTSYMVTIPMQICKALGIKEKTKLKLTLKDNNIILRK